MALVSWVEVQGRQLHVVIIEYDGCQQINMNRPVYTSAPNTLCIAHGTFWVTGIMPVEEGGSS